MNIDDQFESLTWDQPFGPNAAENIDQKVFKSILDNSNSSYASLKTNPSLIIGRRGSGKTSILSAIKLTDRFGVVVEIPSDDTFQEIVTMVDDSLASHVIPETVSKAWQRIIWALLFEGLLDSEIKLSAEEQGRIRKYLASIGYEPRGMISQLLHFVVHIIKSRTDQAETAIDALNNLFDANNTFPDIQNMAANVLVRSKRKAVILIDNIEKIDLSASSMSLAVSGLLMAVDTFKKPTLPVDVRCCIPAEIYPRLTKIAANSDKSFDSEVVLHWTSGELIRLAAIRFREFVRIHAPRSIWEKVQHLNLSDTQDLDEFMHSFFPRTVTNGLGREEYTLRYILRHTQLLPRQFITYLNGIAVEAFSKGADKSFKFPSHSIVNAVQNKEALICRGIFGGYKTVHPLADAICETLLPQMGLTFWMGDFERAHRQALGKLPAVENDRDTLRQLTEIGAVGVVVGQGTDYLNGEFSYNLPLDLALKDTDRFCLHPAFSGAFRSRIDKDGYRPILPRGSELD